MIRISVNQLISITGGQFWGPSDLEVLGPCGLEDISSKCFTYLEDPSLITEKIRNDLDCVGEFFLITKRGLDLDILNSELTILEVNWPRLAFAKLVRELFPECDFPVKSNFIDPSAKIDNDAQIHPNVVIGSNVIIGKCILAKGVKVAAGVQILDGSFIDEDSIIYGGCLIGTRDFSPLIDPSGGVEMHPQLGGVRIGKRVEIYPNTTIARGTFGDTVIDNDVKIDHQCHISHNTTIGNKTIITNGVTVCGSVSIGKQCWIGPGSIIREHIHIENKVFVMMGSVVTKSFGSNLAVGGFPARIVPRIDSSLEHTE